LRAGENEAGGIVALERAADADARQRLAALKTPVGAGEGEN
jgi:hypothetical protein